MYNIFVLYHTKLGVN